MHMLDRRKAKFDLLKKLCKKDTDEEQMDLLQGKGVISDNAVSPEDIAESDLDDLIDKFD